MPLNMLDTSNCQITLLLIFLLIKIIDIKCAVPENIHTPPTEGIGISWGVGGSVRPKNLKKCVKLNWNFQRGGEVLEKILLTDVPP